MHPQQHGGDNCSVCFGYQQNINSNNIITVQKSIMNWADFVTLSTTQPHTARLSPSNHQTTGDQSLMDPALWTPKQDQRCSIITEEKKAFHWNTTWIWMLGTNLCVLLGSRKTNCILTPWGQDKMAAICQTTFSYVFSWMKMYKIRLRFHWSLFPIFQHWFR